MLYTVVFVQESCFDYVTLLCGGKRACMHASLIVMNITALLFADTIEPITYADQKFVRLCYKKRQDLSLCNTNYVN